MVIKLLYDSIVSLIFSNKIIFSYNLIIVCIITVLIKIVLYFYIKKINKKENNILLKSNILDHINDVFLTTGVFISALFSKFEINFVDSLFGIIISILFILSGIKLFKESFNILMDISLDTETKEKIINIILKDKNIIKIDDIHSVSVGY